MAQSCLEIRSMDARHTQIVRSDYQITNPYINLTANLNTVKDLSMKGNMRGHGLPWLPDCHATINDFTRFNFDTDPASNFGNLADQDARLRMLSTGHSLYSPDRPYVTPDTSANIREGQYYVR